MEEDLDLNNKDEYKKLAYKGKKKAADNNIGEVRKVNSERKLTSGILKRGRGRKHSNLAEKKKGSINSSITWDDKTIDQQKDYRKNHPVNKDKLKESKAKYCSNTMIDKDDEYMKALNKVNQINANDEIITKIFNVLNEDKFEEKSLKRNKSCFNLSKQKNLLRMKSFYNITEKEKIFGENLEEEQKLTLQNTLFNKINKDVNVN